MITNKKIMYINNLLTQSNPLLWTQRGAGVQVIRGTKCDVYSFVFQMESWREIPKMRIPLIS